MTFILAFFSVVSLRLFLVLVKKSFNLQILVKYEILKKGGAYGK